MGAARWIGRGDKNAADGAAVDLMRRMINTVTMQGVVVIGEGEKDEAPMLFNNERVGAGFGPEVDVAVDPLEGTRLTALGIPGSISVIAVAERGSMFFPGAALYMEKIAVGPEAAHAIDLRLSPTENVQAVAAAKGMRVSDLTVVVLERERHEELIAELRASGARVNLIRDGDVAPSIAACQPSTGVDMLMGIGGTPEGVISAAAIKCMGGAIQGRLWPRNDGERDGAARGRLRSRPRALGRRSRRRRRRLRRGDRRHGRLAAAGRPRERHGRRDGVDRDAIPVGHRAADRRLPPERQAGEPANGGLMATAELNAIARSIVENDQGHPRRRRVDGHDQEALRRDRGRVDRGEPRAPTATSSSRPTGMEEFIGGVILFDETIRQRADDGTPFAGAARRQGRRAGDQGRHRRAAAGRRARRDGHGGPRRPPEAARRVLRAGRAVRQVAGDPVRRRPPAEPLLRPGQRPGARALRGALPGGGDRPDRRARGADGRRPFDRRLLRRHRADAAGALRGARRPAGRPRGHAAEAEHGDSRQGQRRPGEPRADRRGDARLLPAPRARGRARDRLPLRRPVRGGGDRQSRRDQPARRARLAALVLVRPGAAGVGAAGLAWARGERGGGAGRVPPPGAVQRGCGRRAVRRRARGARPA